MKKVILAGFCLAALVISPAASQDIFTFYPPYTEPSVVPQPTIEGKWSSDAFPRDTFSFEKAGDNFYFLRYNEGGETSQFEAVFTSLGQVLLLDLFPSVPDTIGNWLFRKHVLPAHSFYRVKLEKDSFRIASFSYGWFYSNVLAKGSAVSHTFSGADAILTMSTEDLRRFIEQHAGEPGFFDDDLRVSRIGAPERAKAAQTRTAGSPEVLKDSAVLQTCIPAFPLKEGWLGGDGDISLPLPGRRSLWLFGDTFVGERKKTSRSGAQMIPNTVAITACGPTGESTIEYFWRDRFSDHPRPIFESSTKRYRYWLCGAFMSAGDLYVPLLKIGPKEGAAPGDIFNFTGLGMSLAKIARPAEIPPDEWAIELLPWSCAFHPDAWGCSAFKDGFLYVFEKAEKETVLLKRLHRDHLEDPESHVESFSADGTWRTDVKENNAMALFRGDAGNTVNYHQDIKKWVMVCGPGFLNAKIRIRTAPALEGPWSPEKAVYECPESTPGSPVYDKDNFCYGGGEHAQFYDSKTRTMLITYNCNSTILGKQVSNLGIYSPKVLRIRLDR
jgi:hypothetical protein